MKPTNPNRLYLALDSHGLSYAQQCKKKYWLSSVEHLHGLRTKLVWNAETKRFTPDNKFNAFSLGTFIHDILERMNRLRLRGATGRRVPHGFPVTDDALLKIGMKRIARCKQFTQDERLFHTVKWMECFAELKKQERFLKPVGAEIGFSKVIYEDSDVCFIYEGRIDYIGRNDPSQILSWVDYKTQSKDYVLYENPNQFIGYSWVLGTNLGYVQYYGLQAGSKDATKAEIEKARGKNFRLEPIYHPPGLVNQWRSETIQTFRELASTIPLGERAFRRSRAACTTAWGTCHFTPICDNAWAPQVLEGIKRLHYRKEQWHPWRVKETIE